MTQETFVPLHRVAFETAAEHASRNVPITDVASTAAAIRERLAGQRYESAAHIVVLRGESFAGLIRLEALLAAADDSTAADLMDTDAPLVASGVDQEIAAWRATQHGESALAVVDEQGRFAGLIPPHRLLAVLLTEHEEDLARLGGFLRSRALVRATTEEPLRLRFWHRIPWLVVGLAGALLAADIVARFEAELAHMVMLAFFIPAVVYLADAVGTQTETIVVRGLSVGVGMRSMLLHEIPSGLVIGAALALLAAPLVIWRWGSVPMGITVGLSLFAACSVATLVAMLLPWLLDRAGLDPAFGSGPLATVIQDVLSILIYFLTAAAVLGSA